MVLAWSSARAILCSTAHRPPPTAHRLLPTAHCYLRLLPHHLPQQGLHGVGHLLRRVGAEVVGADHQDGDLGLDPVELAVGDPPEDVLGAVAPDAEVGRVARGVVALPDLDRAVALLVLARPALRDRVAEE